MTGKRMELDERNHSALDIKRGLAESAYPIRAAERAF